MSETSTKALLHLEFDLETTRILCGVPDNFIIALGILAHARRALEDNTVIDYQDADPAVTPLPGRVVIVHCELYSSAISPEVQLHGSPIFGLGMIEWVREGIMERVVRQQFEKQVTIPVASTIGKIQ